MNRGFSPVVGNFMEGIGAYCISTDIRSTLSKDIFTITN